MKKSPRPIPCMLALLALFAVALLSSCQTYTPAFVLSLHEFADPGVSTRLSKQVRNTSREWQYTIKNFPFLDARNFLDGEVYGPDEEGFYGLKIVVSRWSLGNMHHTAGSNLGLVFAVVVDGTYIGTSHFTAEMRDQDILVIEPLWNLYDATKIAENIAANQKHLNSWSRSRFDQYRN
jgi:hypothetical protein